MPGGAVRAFVDDFSFLDADVRVGGLKVETIRLGATQLAFVLPPERRRIALRSRTVIPTHRLCTRTTFARCSDGLKPADCERKA